jgi:4-hydroxybenzoate polyprenyltransferase
MAFAAVLGSVEPIGWWMLVFNFLGRCIRHRVRDGRPQGRREIGMRTSAITFGRYDVLAVALCYARTSPAWCGSVAASNRPVYFVGLLVAVGCAAYHLWLIGSAIAAALPGPSCTTTGSGSRCSRALSPTTLSERRHGWTW